MSRTASPARRERRSAATRRKLPILSDVAQQAAVSLTTASRALDPDLTTMVDNEFRVAGARSGHDPWFAVRVADFPWLRALGVTEPEIGPLALRTALLSFLIALAHQPNNAAYHSALLYAGQHDPAGAVRELRTAIWWNPVWFKPYWLLAQILDSNGQIPEALANANKAAFLSGGHKPEVERYAADLRRRGPRIP